MKPRRAYAKFQPSDKPKKLPPAGHPDWDEYCLPDPKERPTRELTYEECVVAWMIQRALRDTGRGHYPATREDAWRWLMLEDDGEPGTFSWACDMLGLSMKAIIDQWQRKWGAITRPTMEDKIRWNARENARNRRKRKRWKDSLDAESAPLYIHEREGA